MKFNPFPACCESGSLPVGSSKPLRLRGCVGGGFKMTLMGQLQPVTTVREGLHHNLMQSGAAFLSSTT